jgi:hypothetical protein
MINWLIGGLANATQIAPKYKNYLLLVILSSKRLRPPWGTGPAPKEVQDCWLQLTGWHSPGEPTNSDVLEDVGGLRGVIAGFLTARVTAAACRKAIGSRRRE